MRWMLTFVGLLTILGGLWPLLNSTTIIPEALNFVPSEGPIYQGIIILIGLIAVIYGVRARRLYLPHRGLWKKP